MCKIDGCDRDSMYKDQNVCQKHYFRFMRYGTYELTRKPREVFERFSPNGYKLIYVPDHPMAAPTSGFAFEQRVVFYDAYFGEDLHCEFCGADWSFRPYYDHVDHIDEIRLNNDLPNLRALCNACNVGRTAKIQHKSKNNKPLTWCSETKTAQEWGRDDRIPASGWLIRQRLSRGYSLEDAFFAKKITHKDKAAQ